MTSIVNAILKVLDKISAFTKVVAVLFETIDFAKQRFSELLNNKEESENKQ